MNNISIAIAVNNEDELQNAHFGDAFKFLLYYFEDGKLIFKKELENQYRNFEEEKGNVHGSKMKGELIVELLEKEGVNVLVSKQFGKNIRLINCCFIPVMVGTESKEAAKTIIENHLNWIEEELQHKSKDYALFAIKKGIMKRNIKK